MSDEPEFVICTQCETPTYEFEWMNDQITVALCGSCGNDDPSDFKTEADLEQQG